MASIRHLYDDVENIIHEIVEVNQSYDVERQRRFYAVVLLQRVWRGTKVRMDLKKLNNAATTIQKWVRRYLAYIHLPDVMRRFIERLKMRFFNIMATKIQALWKGYRYRKRCLNLKLIFQVRKSTVANSETAKRIQEEILEDERQHKIQVENDAKQSVYSIIGKLHYLLRTENVPGVFSVNSKPLKYSCVEKLLKSVSFRDEIAASRKLYNERYNHPKEQTYLLGEKYAKVEQLYWSRDRSYELRKPEKIKEPTKRFNLTRIQEKKHEMAMFALEQYQTPKEYIFRESDPSKNISKDKYEVSTKMVKPVSKVPPYYSYVAGDYCEIHDIPDN